MDAIYKNSTGYGLPKEQAKRMAARFWKRALVASSAGMAYALAQSTSDPDYMKMSLDEQLNNITIPLPGTEAEAKLPINWDMGTLVYTMPQLFVRSVLLSEDNPAHLSKSKAGEEAFKALRRSVFPPLLESVAITPVLEGMTNKDISTLPFVKDIEGRAEQKLPSEMRGEKTASVIGNALGKVVLSPKRVDHILQNFGGIMYSLLDSALQPMFGEPVNKTPAKDTFLRAIGVKQFVTDPEKLHNADKMYELYGKGLEAQAGFNELLKTADSKKISAYREEHQKEFENLSIIQPQAEVMNAYKNQIDRIVASDMPNPQKEEAIKALKKQIQQQVDLTNEIIKNKEKSERK
jgi:hypothetical protein